MSQKNEMKYKDIGGQAVMEGVMMQSPANESIAIAVRRPNGKILVTCEHREPLSKKHKWMGLPIIRVSVDHGTAFDVAGKGIANDSAMTLSIDYATRMAIYRRAKALVKSE